MTAVRFGFRPTPMGHATLRSFGMELFPDWEVHPDYCEVRLVQLLTHLIDDFARYGSLHAGALALPGLTAGQVSVLHEPAVNEPQPYARGWIVAEPPWAGGRALHHAGSNTNFFALIWVAPERDLVLVAAANLGGDAAFAACDEAIGWMLQHAVE